MTIVGLEKHRDGKLNLLVFDPSFKTAPGMLKLLGMDVKKGGGLFGAFGGGGMKGEKATQLLEAYRRGEKTLRRHRNFEILKLRESAGERGWA